MQETQVQSLTWGNLLEKEMTTHSTILAWKSHEQRSLEGYNIVHEIAKESDMTCESPSPPFCIMYEI